ncbi:MAG: YggT family protein [Anaerolineae bacterium]|jgi:YggT family protein|nr:YggT family protein [Chloroflexota bacterium]
MIVLLINFVKLLAQALNIAIFVRVILSWLPMSPDSPLVRLLLGITEPILGPIRRILPRTGLLDLSPFFGLILISLAEQVLLMALRRLA